MTSLVDFYGFAGKGGRTIDELERELSEIILEAGPFGPDERIVVPYVQMHEFEGLLFSAPKTFETIIGSASSQAIRRLEDIRSQFPTPEHINDNTLTAPSKRISEVIPTYRKRLHGPTLANEMGLAVIRRECPRFNDWLSQLESLGATLR